MNIARAGPSRRHLKMYNSALNTLDADARGHIIQCAMGAPAHRTEPVNSLAGTLMGLSHIHSGSRTASKKKNILGIFFSKVSYGRRDSFFFSRRPTDAVVLSWLLPILPAFLSDR